MTLADELKKSYVDWVNKSFEYSNLEGGFVRIDTPFIDNSSDAVVLYAVPKGKSTITITDDGWTIDGLKSHGVYINKSRQRKQMLERQLKLYGVSTDGEDIFIETDTKRFGEAKHRILQAILFVSDMFMLSKSNTSNLFLEDVRNFFAEEKIRAVRNASYTGKSGLTHKFEFSIPDFGDEAPLRLIKVMSTANNSLFAKSIVTDVEQTRPMVDDPTNTKFYVMVNDLEKTVNEDILALFENSLITPILFSKKLSFVSELAK